MSSFFLTLESRASLLSKFSVLDICACHDKKKDILKTAWKSERSLKTHELIAASNLTHRQTNRHCLWYKSTKSEKYWHIIGG